ncbi:polysaccharide biosynthesis/export family protein [Emticicia sp. W12TSBA100-4]|uniref:polysaccharide biosynthesis/export family protein n=1 Tax=Emticicia sp. W12TSBA100-4 TaxID=3160965 RepID=UPI003305C3B7
MVKLFSYSTLKRILVLGVLLVAVLHLQSCINTPPIAYFQSSDSLKFQQLKKIQPTITRIQRNDILAITVGSLNQESNEIMNFANVNALTTTNFPGQQGLQRNQPLGYLVDSSGHVEVPFVGRLKLLDMTLEEAANVVRAEVIKSLKDPAINVRFLNHKFSVLGEVNRSGTFNLLDDRTTLPEALAMAGDLTIYGSRTNIMVLRENNGIREVARLNLLNQEVFDSPYYYIQNGDLIYIEPIKAKGTFTDQRLQLIPIYTGIATTAVVVLSLLVNILK